MPSSPRRLLTLAVLVAAGLVLAACGGEDQGATAEVPAATATPEPWSAAGIRSTQDRAGFFPQVANSNVGQGPTRLQVALFDTDGEMVHGAQVSARLYYFGEEEGAEAERVEGEFVFSARSIDLDEGQVAAPAGSTHPIVGGDGAGSTHLIHHPSHVTVYVANVDLDRTGWWGAELDVEVDGERHEDVRLRFWVQERTDEPDVGDPVPATQQPTVDDVDDIADIDSSRPPNPELHQVTVAEALEAGEPFVVAFVTPAFCQTRFCGPVMEAVVVPAWRDYGDRVRFIHIEPFDIPRAREGVLEPVEATQEWRLRVEPVIFVVDRDGRIAAKFEGILELEELAEALDAVLARG